VFTIQWNGRAILTQYIRPPIPIRDFDWQSYILEDDESNIIGFGPTKNQAIANLIQELVENV
jgi:hypothetical protein